MKKAYLLMLLVNMCLVSAVYAQPAIYSESNITQTGIGTYETFKCAQGQTKIWTDSIYTSYNWSTGDTTPMITLNTTGLITLTVGGGGSSTVNAFQDQLANQNTLYSFPGEEACNGDVIQLQTFVDPGGWVLWSWGDTVFSDSDCDLNYFPGCGMNITTSGSYSYLRYGSFSGCYYNSYSVGLNFYSNPSTTISQSNDTLYANAAGANSYQWFDGNQNPISNATNAWYQPIAPDSYYVEASNSLPTVTCTGPRSAGYYWTSNCIASYSWYVDTTAQYSIIVVNTSVPSPGTGVSYLWDFGDGNTSTQAFPQHQYGGAGTYNVCVTVSDGTCSSTYCDNITVVNKVAAPFSINVVDPGSLSAFTGFEVGDMEVWPQPADDKIGMRFTLEHTTTVQVEMFDIQGQKVKYLSPMDLTTGEQQLNLDCSDLGNGMYLILFQAGEKSFWKKVSVVR